MDQTFRVTFADSPELILDVRRFSVDERMSSGFLVSLVAHSHDDDIDFDALVGKRASFEIEQRVGASLPSLDGATGPLLGPSAHRLWTGVCAAVRQVAAHPAGLSTYQVTIVPELWLLRHRTNHRVHQYLSEPDIALELLATWGIPVEKSFDGASYPARKFKLQYGETDYDFFRRMLEEAGVAFLFEERDQEDGTRGSRLVLCDHPEARPAREPLQWVDDAEARSDATYATDVLVGQEIRSGAVVFTDYDHRRPSFRFAERAASGSGLERNLETFHHSPGSFLYVGRGGSESPTADDRGAARVDAKLGAALAEKRLAAVRVGARSVTFRSNALDLAPGSVVPLTGHPHRLLEGEDLLVLETEISGHINGEVSLSCTAVLSSEPYRPPLSTPRPVANGIENAIVVGPPGEEIHTDEFGRVRVQFHWDREGVHDEKSSCWIHVSQAWAGSGFGGLNLPRVGQEVVVGFFGGDPDRPVVVGRLYNNVTKTPYKLPESKTMSGLRSSSTGGSGGYNEIRMDDRAGGENLHIRAQKDLTKEVLGCEFEITEADRCIGVGQRLILVATDIEMYATRIRLNGKDLTDIKGGEVRINCEDAPPPEDKAEAPEPEAQPAVDIMSGLPVFGG